MKKFIFILSVLLVFLLLGCEEESSGVSVTSVDPASDLTNYTDNGVALTTEGTNELMGAMYMSMEMGMLMATWGQNDPDLSALIPQTGVVLRAMTLPTEAEIQEMITAFEEGGTFDVSATITNEVIDLSTVDATVDGTLTVDGTVSVNGTVSNNTGTNSGSDTMSGSATIDMDLEGFTKGTNTLPTVMVRFKTNVSGTHNYTPTTEDMTASVNAAVSIGFSLSDYYVEGTRIASGKYVFTLNMSESVTVDFEAEDQTIPDITATLKLDVYDNSGTLRKSYEFDEEDIEAMMS